MTAPKTRILLLNSLDERYGSTYRIRAIRDLLITDGYSVSYLEGGGGIFPRLIQAALTAFRTEYDVLYAQKFNPITLAALAIAKLRGKRVLVDWDDFEVGFQGSLLKKSIAVVSEAIGPCFVERITTHSREIAKRAEKRNVPVSMIQQGFDDRIFRPGAPQRAESNEFRVGHLCTLTTGGALDLEWILREWAKVRNEKVRFLLIGGGPLESKFRQVIHDLDLKDRVTMTGLVDHERVPEHLSALDLAVIWMSDSEANRARVSFKVIEYLAMNVPVLGRVVGETENLFGHLIQRCEHENLAAAIERMSQNAPRRPTAESVKEYRWNVIGERLGEKLCL